MPGDVRHEDPETYYLLSNRTAHGEFLFRPDDECVRICRGVLAWSANRHEPDLAAFIFISNHFHLVAGFPDQNRGPFMRVFQGELARRIKKHRGRSGDDSTVFPRRYHCEALLDGEALMDAISYTANNAVRHGLVTHPGAWPDTSGSCDSQSNSSFKNPYVKTEAIAGAGRPFRAERNATRV